MRRLLFRLLLVLLLVGVCLAGWQWWDYAHRPVVAEGEQASFEVPRGHVGSRLADALKEGGIAVAPWKLALALRLRGDAARIKAGQYVIAGPATLPQVLGELVSGQIEKGRLFTLIDGWTFRDVRAALKRAPELKDTISGMSDEVLMAELGSASTHPEGRFAPDTYAYRPGSTDIELLRRAHALQQRRLEAAWAGRSDGLTLKSPDELLVLASIVEKETGHEADREMVASVFHNRLRTRMPLQSDPTTIYGLGETFDGNLRRADLRSKSPYNTYVHKGLPPTPIALPSLRALEATARPAVSDKFYFVARGDGRSEFSADLASHNRAVNRFQRGRGQGPLHGTAAGAASAEGRTGRQQP